MRPIDADALLTERKKSKYYHLPNGDIAIPIIDVEHALTVKPKPQWIPCSERLPSETVIATVETKSFKHRYVCEAVWIPRWTWKASFDEWEDCSEYNEDDDEYYVLEGWYERIHNWDEYAYVAIDDNVIAWIPLPEPYKGGDSE